MGFMISDKKNQGKFHLLAIVLIPLNLVMIFLPKTIYPGICTILISAGIVYAVIFWSDENVSVIDLGYAYCYGAEFTKNCLPSTPIKGKDQRGNFKFREKKMFN